MDDYRLCFYVELDLGNDPRVGEAQNLGGEVTIEQRRSPERGRISR